MLVQILLATYNGEKFLAEQIDSILAQTYQDFELLIRDDASKDGTVNVARQYAERHPGRIRLLDNADNAGVVRNFMALLSESTARYIMFCDQDDVWLPTKIESSVTLMLKLEADNPDIPVLVHSDLIVTDQQLNPLSQSYFSMQKLPLQEPSFNALVMQNVVTGCTVLINRTCALLALKLDGKVVMHDWWMAMIAKQFGKIGFLESPTMLYRQHSGNVIGASSNTFLGRLKKARRLFNKGDKHVRYDRQIDQCATFVRTFGDLLSTKTRAQLTQFANLNSMSPLPKRAFLLRNGFLRYGLINNALLMLYI